MFVVCDLFRSVSCRYFGARVDISTDHSAVFKAKLDTSLWASLDSFSCLQDYVLVVPESSYRSSYLSEEPLDKSYDFISNCGQNSFYIRSADR